MEITQPRPPINDIVKAWGPMRLLLWPPRGPHIQVTAARERETLAPALDGPVIPIDRR